MTKKDKQIKALLDAEVCNRNHECELSYERPDPLLVASRYNDESIILLCAMYGYGKARLIVKFLDGLDFSLLEENEEKIETSLKNHYYRFQNSADVIASFIALKRLKNTESLHAIFLKAYKKEHNVLEGIDALVRTIHHINPRETQGYRFLFSTPLKRDKKGNIKLMGNAPYKRWQMFLRWMVRKESLDLGLWNNINTKDLILPLDTHTFNVSQKLGLLQRKTYDLQSAVEITNKLKAFDKHDPIKYDFALYRIGQEKLV